LHVRDVSKTYDRRFSEIGNSIVYILIFLLGSLLNIPISMQDTIIHVTTTSIVGYTAVIHLRLFFIYPLLAAVPTLFFSIIFHFFVQTGRANSNLRHQKLSSTVKKKNRTSSIEDPIIEKALNVSSLQNETGSSLHVKRRMSLIQGVNLLKSMAQQSDEEYDVEDEDEDDKHDELSISDDSDDSHEISIENEQENTHFAFASSKSSSFEHPSTLSQSYNSISSLHEYLFSDLSSSVKADAFDSPSESTSSEEDQM
jgi:hypothetical protein